MKLCRSTIRMRCCRYPMCRKTLHHPTRPRVTLLLISLVGIIILSMASNDFKEFLLIFYKLQNASMISKWFWLAGEISIHLEKGGMRLICHLNSSHECCTCVLPFASESLLSWANYDGVCNFCLLMVVCSACWCCFHSSLWHWLKRKTAKGYKAAGYM